MLFDFIETGRGIQILYQYAKQEILESDFFDLTAEGYQQLSEIEQTQKWYILNAEKLNQNYIEEGAYFIVNEKEKNILLRAVQFIHFTSEKLATNASFLERLLYSKHCMPDCFFSTSTKNENENCRIIQLGQSDDKN
ncbi:hypothetical protein CE557_583 [Cardinium endosymbiont of Sogatella furcifera]|uniref:hypothetical protein n=1 Tax=Cardinium endosymbiont of Sogatella furcifera TaxID=650378 RepID=UPI000E0DB4A6|nr:hypothetical protein [Cardinium endosymbiont of Sogatella furcifera]AXI24391.1 hypothetical protein CE557_583 [Cardinium endosymbiont of Sogatella furcifera]